MSTTITLFDPLTAAQDPLSGAAVFADYRCRRGDQTLRQQDAALRLFANYLMILGFEVDQLNVAPDDWHSVTWGLVAGFARWLLNQGYATRAPARSAGVGTVNARLSVVKTYATLASRAGTIPATELALIQTVSGYRGNEAHRIDQNRVMGGQPTRVGLKKAEPVRLTPDQATTLKQTPGTSPQSHRDRLMMCLLLDHGLRCSELAGIQAANVDFGNGASSILSAQSSPDPKPYTDPRRPPCHRGLPQSRHRAGWAPALVQPQRWLAQWARDVHSVHYQAGPGPGDCDWR